MKLQTQRQFNACSPTFTNWSGSDCSRLDDEYIINLIFKKGVIIDDGSDGLTSMVRKVLKDKNKK